MMTVHPLGPDGFRYLIGSVTRQDELPERPVPHQRVRGALAGYYLQTGNPPGEWLGSLAADLGVVGAVTEQQMARLYGYGQHPVTGEQLGRRYPRFAPLSERVAERESALLPRPERAEAGREWGLTELADGELAELDGYAQAAVEQRTGHQISDANAALVGLDGYAQRALIREQEHRAGRNRVAGVDLVFSPPKSVQSLWALATITGDDQVRDRVEGWVRSARDLTLERLETQVAFGRLGAGGRVWVPVDGVAAAAFLHRSSRAGDPNLHWHVAVASKVRVRDPRGREAWVALDTRSLHKAAVSLSEMFNGEVERLAMADGYRFAPRKDQVRHGSRAVRELQGIPAALNRAWSRRRVQVEDNYERLLTGFRADKGRDPEPHEQYRLAQQACLVDRPAKHRGPGPGEEIAFWEHLAREALGADTDLHKILAATRSAAPQLVTAADITAEQHHDLVRRTVAAVSEHRAWWTVRHLAAEAERQTRGIAFTAAADRQNVVNRIVTAATTPDAYVGAGLGSVVRADRRSIVAEPPRLLRGDGESVFREPAATEYTTSRMLLAEDRILRTAQATGAPRIGPAALDEALARAAQAGPPLAADQEAAIRALAGSGRWLDVLIGPAGSGKTTTLRVLVDAARTEGWTVIGLAPSAKAAKILGDQTGVQMVENTRQWELNLATGRVPPRPRTLVLIDEATLGHTPTLDAIIGQHTAAGGIVRLVGDPRQLASPGAGGLLRWLHQQHGGVELTSLWRFRNQWEAAATLRLRDGDPSVIEEYLAHDRVRHGSAAAMKDQLYQWWLSQRTAGKTALMLVQSNADVADLSARARRDLVAAGIVEETGTSLRDGNVAGRGDQVVTRRVDRTLRYNGGKDYVRNGDTWQVTRRHQDGSLTLRHATNSARIRISADWLEQWAELAYAVTGTRAQGMTVDVSGSLLRPDATSRNAAYTQLTRGTELNLLFLVTDTVLDPDGDPVQLVNLTPTAAFTTILHRRDDDTVAHERRADATAAEQSIRTLTARYRYVVDILTAERRDTDQDAAAIDPDRAAELAAALPAELAATVLADPAWPALAARLQAIAELGRDPATELTEAAGSRELGTSDSLAQVLHWRLGARIPALAAPTRPAEQPALRGERVAVAPWLPAPPTDAPPALGDLIGYLNHTRAAIEIRAAQLAAEATAAPWTTPLGEPPLAGAPRRDWLVLTARIAAYREAFTVTDPRPLGDLPDSAGAGQRATHQALAEALAEHTRRPHPQSDPPGSSAADRSGRNPAHEGDQQEPERPHEDLSDQTLAREIANAERAAIRNLDQAIALTNHADQITATADAGAGPAARSLHTHRNQLAQQVAAITAAEPYVAAYHAAGRQLEARETEHAALLRRRTAPSRTRPSRRSQRALTDQTTAVEYEIGQLRAGLETDAARVGHLTAATGPIHQWTDTRHELANLEHRYPDALTAAIAIDRAAADPWYDRANRLRQRSTKSEHRAAQLRAEQRHRTQSPAAIAVPHPQDPAFGSYEPDIDQLGYPPTQRPPRQPPRVQPTAARQLR